MAINLLTQYPGKVGAISGAWPYGEPRNITTPGDGTGTPWEVALAKDIVGLQQSLLKSAAIVPSGTPEQVGASEYLQSLVELSSGRAVAYNVGGTANAITLNVRTNQQGPASYFTGLNAKFTATADNTGGVTVNIAGLGIKTVLDGETGLALIAKDIRNGSEYELIYNGTNLLLIKNAKFTFQQFTPRLISKSGATETGQYNGTFVGIALSIGDLAFISMQFNITGVTSDVTNPLKVVDLPFTIASAPTTVPAPVFNYGSQSAIQLGSDSFAPVLVGGVGDSRIDLLMHNISTTSTANSAMTGTHVNQSGGILSMAGFFRRS